MKTVSLFAGSDTISGDESDLATQVGTAIGVRGWQLRGAGYKGLMSVAAESCIRAGGLAQSIQIVNSPWGVAVAPATSLRAVSTHEERLACFLEADACIVLPGGLGTLHEMSFALWWSVVASPVTLGIYGERAVALFEFIRENRWFGENREKHLGFVKALRDLKDLERWLDSLA